MGHATVEWVYVGVVIALLTWVGAESWNVERVVEHVPAEAETIKVIGQQWFWTFEHEDGKKETGELHLKQGVPYKFEIVSKDVIHDFNVPDYTILMDAVPGRVNVVWNMFDQPGEFNIQCREYCGFGHPTMKAKLFVEPQTAEAATATNATAGAAAPAQAPAGQNATSATAGEPGTPLTILEGSSVQGSPDFDPDTLTVKKGDKITVTNKDTLPHTVTSGASPSDPNSAKQFDTSIIEAGATADIETASIDPGEYPFHCSVHPYMTGKLVIQPQTAEAAAPAANETATTGASAANETATTGASEENATAATSNSSAGQNTTSATAGASGTPLTILEGSSVQGSPSFDPATLTVKKGDKITVTNKDTLPHTVTSGSSPSDPNNAKLFDTSIIEAGATADIETASIDPGEYPFHCTVHPYMTGKLVVQ